MRYSTFDTHGTRKLVPPLPCSDDPQKARSSPTCAGVAARLSRAALASWLGLMLAGCAGKQPQGVADVPECRQTADSIVQVHGESNIEHLRRQADAYSDCMTAHGYRLDEERLTEQLTHLQQVQASNIMRGDPSQLIALRREQLRLSPSMWQPGSPVTPNR